MYNIERKEGKGEWGEQTIDKEKGKKITIKRTASAYIKVCSDTMMMPYISVPVDQ